MLKRAALVLAVVMSLMVLGIGRAGAEAPAGPAAPSSSGEGVAPSDAPFVAPFVTRGAERYPESYWAAQASQDAGLATPWLPVHVFGLVEEGLGSMGMARADLDFSKRVAGPQEHLLEPVRRTLDESLSVPSVAHGLVETPDPWVTLGVISPERMKELEQWLKTLDYEGLLTAVCGETPQTHEAAAVILKRRLGERGMGGPIFSHYVDYVNRNIPGREIKDSELTGATAQFPVLAMLAACVRDDLRQRVGPSTAREESATKGDERDPRVPENVRRLLDSNGGMGNLFDGKLNGRELVGDPDNALNVSQTAKAALACLGRGAGRGKPQLHKLSLAEACVVWPRVSEVLATEMYEAMRRTKSDFENRRPDAARFSGELIMSGIKASVYDLGGENENDPTVFPKMVVTIAGFGNDRHAPLEAKHRGLGECQPVLLVDVGGADEYPLCCAVAGPNEFVAVYDFGDDPDHYGGGPLAVWREPFADRDWMLQLGPCTAFMGCAVLQDYGGDDTYTGGDFSIGAAWIGAAHLTDRAGSDVYRGGQFSQGAAAFGLASLVDLGETPKLGEDAPTGYELGKLNSNDSYSCARYGQGFGFVLGVGRLEDTGGNDRYYAGGVYRHMPLWNDRYQTLSQGMGFGWRSENVAGGIGMLIDRGEGNDSYEADIYGQGSSYWYSLGVCWDGGGNDHYRLGHYGQGAGIHLSSGILIDLGGHDTYTNFYGVGTGGAHDYAVGWLVDVSGDDTYSSSGLAQGLNNSTAIFYDGGGDDCYSSKADSGIACGVNNSVALLIDAGGFDRYTIPVTNGLWHVRGEYGIVMDLLAEKDKPVDMANVQVWRTDSAATMHRESLREAAKKAAELAASGSGPSEQVPAAVAKTPDPVPHSAGRKASKEELDTLWAKACEWEVGTPENIASIGAARRTLVELGALEFLLTQLHHTYPLQLRALWGTVPYFGAAAVDGLLGVAEQANSRLKGNQSARTAEQIAHDVGRRRNGIDLLTRLKSELVNAEIRGDCMAMVADVADEREQIRLLTSLARWESEHDALRTRFLALLKSKQDIVRKLAVEGLAPLMKVEAAWDKSATAALLDRVIMDEYFAVRYTAMRLVLGAPDFSRFSEDDIDPMQTTNDSPNADQDFLYSAVVRGPSYIDQTKQLGSRVERIVGLLVEVSLVETTFPKNYRGPLPGWLTLVVRQLLADLKQCTPEEQITLSEYEVVTKAQSVVRDQSDPRSIAAILELSIELESLEMKVAELTAKRPARPSDQSAESPKEEGSTK